MERASFQNSNRVSLLRILKLPPTNQSVLREGFLCAGVEANDFLSLCPLVLRGVMSRCLVRPLLGQTSHHEILIPTKGARHTRPESPLHSSANSLSLRFLICNVRVVSPPRGVVGTAGSINNSKTADT